MSSFRHLAFALAVPLAIHGAAATPAAAQADAAASSVARAVDTNVIRAHTEFLSDDALEGRGPGTRGGLVAARYIAAQFERLGLVPAGDSNSYYHRVPVISLTPTAQARLEGGSGASELKFKDDYVMWSMRNDASVSASADLVFVGYGIVAPEYGWDDYKGADVKGKIVVTLVNTPGLVDTTLFKGKVMTYYGRWTYKIEEAARQGAAGIMIVHTPESATYGWPTVVGSWTGPQTRVERDPTSLLIAGWFSQAESDRVLQPVGGLEQAIAKASKKGFTAVPLNQKLSATVQSTIRRSETYNILGRRPGKGAKADEVVLIGGHYDHLGISQPVDGDSIYNGAVDNASGTAAMLAAAEAFARSGVTTPRSIVFMAFAAEESGLLGSTAFAERPSIPLKQIAAVLNMDVMNLYGKTRDISALGLDQSSLGQTFTAAAKAEGLRVIVNRDALIKGSFFRSDHFPLARNGVPSLSLESGLDFVGRPEGWGKQQQDEYNEKRYHQPSDELLPWYTFAGAAQQVRVIVRAAVAAAQAANQPTWAAGSEFKAAGERRLNTGAGR
ncbi:MAG TPA: M20/M25/M40 family metallo-hydrolase [Gemmatimonadales bacterium]|nr:M20/M25/M40 family metallo-hydrolase [Gemmatimonadales bacterium]